MTGPGTRSQRRPAREAAGAEPAILSGVAALVTGASRGLGLGVATALARAGARVWMAAELEDELLQAADEVRGLGGTVRSRVVDLADPEQRSALAAELVADERDLRVVVNNAAVLERSAVAEVETEHWQRVLSVNLTAPVFLTRDLLPTLLRQGGSVINVSSRAGIHPFAAQSAYCASKFGLEAFTRCLALELGGTSVSANTVTPGLPIKPTSLTRAEAERAPPASRAEWCDPITLGPAFVFLAGLRGEVSGFRFDALTLTRAVEELGTAATRARIADLAEHVPGGVE
jgi:NAD(P)-dependent dehydrogenase (short-subunit alcohol dehydrogenase family)